MLAHPRTIIITSCTNRKKNTGEIVALRGHEATDSLEALVRAWVAAVDAAQRREPVLTLYQGRAFSEAKSAANVVGALLYVASAGHGLVHSEKLLPSYDLTVAANSSNALHLVLNRLRKTPADWWQTLTNEFKSARSLAALMSDPVLEAYTVLVAMPSTYLSMLQSDLASLSDQQISRLRIITSEFGTSQLPERLRDSVLPYDERLEGNAAYAGTRNDFAQRALRHFVVELQGHQIPLSIARERVANAMNVLVKPKLPHRERKSDSEIEELVLRNWHHHKGSQSALLRWLRDEQFVSCEQGRFRLLWRRVQSQLTVG
jgi:hypothetical protein